jgi:hypothetical protein
MVGAIGVRASLRKYARHKGRDSRPENIRLALPELLEALFFHFSPKADFRSEIHILLELKSPPPYVMLSYDTNSIGHGKGRLLMERSYTVRVIYHMWVFPLRLFSHFLQAAGTHGFSFLARRRVGKVFHVRSHVSFAV